MNEEMRHEIVRRRQGGASLRRIAKDLGLARDTVQSVVRRWEAERAGHGAPGPVPVPDRRPSLVDPFNDTIQQLLQRYPDITIARVFEELRARGFGGGLTIVRERVLELRPQPLREPVVRFETPPGADYLHLVEESTDHGPQPETETDQTETNQADADESRDDSAGSA